MPYVGAICDKRHHRKLKRKAAAWQHHGENNGGMWQQRDSNIVINSENGNDENESNPANKAKNIEISRVVFGGDVVIDSCQSTLYSARQRRTITHGGGIACPSNLTAPRAAQYSMKWHQRKKSKAYQRGVGQ